MLLHTAVGRCGVVTKISSSEWQAGFLGIASNAEIDFIGENDPMAKDQLSRDYDISVEKIHSQQMEAPVPDPPAILSSPLLLRYLALPAM